jgi:hypothetical protein
MVQHCQRWLGQLQLRQHCPIADPAAEPVADPAAIEQR